MTVCDACSATVLPSRNVDGYWYGRCERCGYLQLLDDLSEPAAASLYSDAYFFGGRTGGYEDYFAEGTLLRDQGRRYARLLGRFTRPSTLLDVGSAAGFVAAGFRDAGWSVRGVELNAGMSAWARRNLQLPVDTTTLERFETDERFDAVAMIQVAAHFFDLNAAFERAAELTKTGGYWLVETWNAGSVTAKVLGAQWHEFSPPSVRRIFTPKNLARTVSQYGFDEVARGRPVKRILASHAKSLLRQKAGSGAATQLLNGAARLLPDRVTLPYPAEDLFWAVFRKRA